MYRDIYFILFSQPFPWSHVLLYILFQNSSFLDESWQLPVRCLCSLFMLHDFVVSTMLASSTLSHLNQKVQMALCAGGLKLFFLMRVYSDGEFSVFLVLPWFFWGMCAGNQASTLGSSTPFFFSFYCLVRSFYSTFMFFVSHTHVRAAQNLLITGLLCCSWKCASFHPAHSVGL